jgi:DNA invertase Pin-like site-specific DNA recombinase
MLSQGIATKPVWPVAIYARLSKNKPQRCWDCDGRGEHPDQTVCGTCHGKEQTAGLSTNTAIQVAECRAELEELADDRRVELDIVAIFEEDDTGASKFSTKPRPLFDSLIDLARENRIQTIISTEPERLYRKPKDADQVITVSETTGLKELYFTAEGGSIDLTSPNGICQARDTAGLGERESNKTSRRQRRKQADKARLGKATGGHRAFGFVEGDPRLGGHYRPHNTEPNAPEVKALKDMAARYIAG